MKPLHLVYGDFNCPLSLLASSWCDELTRMHALAVEWRAVEHDPGIPRRGRPLDDALAVDLAAQVDEVAQRLVRGGRIRLALPPVLPNSSLAIGAFAGQHAPNARRLRRALFAAVWRDGLNVGRWAQLDRVLTTPLRVDFARADRWRRSWADDGHPRLPAIVLPSGAVLQHEEALRYLDDRVARTTTAVPQVHSEERRS